ncbi:MAG: short-chain dehydrogenase [Candidatus Cloacimonetes bacterium]|nr:short-chain dehydrogenase [Candidatus Cloacimonadota bacterium]
MTFTLENFFFNTPLYSPIIISEDEQDELFALFGSTERRDFNGYNPYKKIETTFEITTYLLGYDSNYLESGGFNTVKIKCKRSGNQFWFYILWRPSDRKLIKIGQFPSVADFHIYEIKQYKKLLPEGKLKEFTRAIGLAANGVGIGSFVYLRRIFEHLIQEAFQKALEEKAIKEADFQTARMDEKIDLLNNYLPEFLVENKGMYSILSLGIHELDEKTCLAHFDTLRVGIEIILDEKLDELRKKEKIELAKKKLSSLKSKIKK